MGNPFGIALFYCVATESRLKVVVLAGAVSAVVILGSIGLVRFANRERQQTPAIVAAAASLADIPDSLIQELQSRESFSSRRDEFARELMDGVLPVDSVRTFYASYAMWMRDGRWDSSEVHELSQFLGLETTP